MAASAQLGEDKVALLDAQYNHSVHNDLYEGTERHPKTTPDGSQRASSSEPRAST